MAVIRAKTLDLKRTRSVTPLREQNTLLNITEAREGKTTLTSLPQRLVFELTNDCNLNCVMCGRNNAEFNPNYFRLEWLEVFTPVLEQIEEVTLMGWGEPTVHPEFVTFLEWAKRYGLRKYFCTNGVRLGELFHALFSCEVDIIAVSIDAASSEKNNAIRRGMDFMQVLTNLRRIVAEKKRAGTLFPYINFVFTAMRSNLDELIPIIELTAEVGLEELKVVYLTAFGSAMEKEILFEEKERLIEVFAAASKRAEELGIDLKLPHLPGEDSAGEAWHKPCYTAWRDLFVGSDGDVRPCMSTAQKLFAVTDFTDFTEMWNAEAFREHRRVVNDQSKMSLNCRNCYQSAVANWNQLSAFLQSGADFSPSWKEE